MKIIIDIDVTNKTVVINNSAYNKYFPSEAIFILLEKLINDNVELLKLSNNSPVEIFKNLGLLMTDMLVKALYKNFTPDEIDEILNPYKNIIN